MKELACCPVCVGATLQVAYEGRSLRDPDDSARWPVAECRGCGHRFVNPQPSWDELQRYYVAQYDPYEADHGVDDFERTVADARRTGRLRHVDIRPGLRLLDVGCGGGSFLRTARELGAVTAGVEPSEHGAATARKAGLDVFNGSLTDFVAKSPQARFDQITSCHVVEHHPDPVSFLKEMRSLLAPGGSIFIAVPNAGNPSARKLGWRWHSADLPYHLQQFCESSLRRAIESAGLVLRELRTESFARTVLHSLHNEWRQSWKLPVRVSQRLPLEGYADREVQRLDEAREGEALLATMAATAAA